jgi:hypothetical protein
MVNESTKLNTVMVNESTRFNNFPYQNLISFMTYHQVCNKSNTTGDTCGAGTANPSGAPELTPVLVAFMLLDL